MDRPNTVVKKTFRAWALAVGAALLLLSIPASSGSPGEQKPGPLTLTLRECIARTLAASLEVSIEAMNPAILDESVAEAGEKYLPAFALSYFNQDRTILGTWGVEGTSYGYKYDFYNATLSQRLPTGGTATLAFAHSMTNTERSYTLINPSYYSQLELAITQPLLKGFGPKVEQAEKRRARYQADVALQSLKATLLQTVCDAEIAYWNLVYSLESLRVAELSLEQSREILKRSQEGARVGTKSAVEVLSAETEVAGWENSAFSARLQVERMEDALRKLMNMAAGDPFSVPAVIPADKPEFEKRTFRYEDALAVALRERPEMAVAENELAQSAAEIGYAKNQLLPGLNLQFSAWNPGQSGVKYVYQDGNPFSGVVVDVIKGSRADSIKDAFRQGFKSWTLSLDFTLPLGDVFSRARLARARLESEQVALDLEKKKRDIGYEVAEALKDLAANQRKVETSAAYRALLEKRVAAELQRYQVGLAGSEWLFSYQRQLAQARNDESRALIDCRIALARLEKAMGTTLKAKNLKFREFEF
jgi:outer membrane protein TolC